VKYVVSSLPSDEAFPVKFTDFQVTRWWKLNRIEVRYLSSSDLICIVREFQKFPGLQIQKVKMQLMATDKCGNTQ
jgi:hypothetical protein